MRPTAVTRATLALLLLSSALPLAACGKKSRGHGGEHSTSASGVTSQTTGGGTTPATPGATMARVADHGDPNGEEQELIELAQRARKDPVAEAARLNARHGLSLDFSSYPARPPLSPNEFLSQAAAAHTSDMATRGFYGHQNPDGVNANGRILATIYDLNPFFGVSPAVNLTENLGMGTGSAPGNGLKTPQSVHDTLMIDAGVQGAKHRSLLLGVGQYALYRELGLSYLHRGTSDWIVEEVAFTKTDRPFVLGVAYDDRDGDGVCRSGEGTPAVPVILSHASGFTVSTATRTAGGFSFEVFVDGTYTLTIGGDSTTVVVQGASVKVDRRSGQLVR